MKKVLLVIDNLGSGGAQNQITLLACELKNKGYDVAVFTYFPQAFFKKRLIDSGVTLHYHAKNGKLGLNVIFKLSKLIKSEKIDILISFLNTPNFYTVVAKKIARRNIKLIISYRSLTNFSLLSKVELLQKKWVNNNSNIVIANSHHERERWQEKFPDQATKWKTIYNAIDQNKFNFLTKVSKINSYLVVGSVSSDKNGLLILEAMRILHEKGVKIYLKWVGQKVFTLPDRKAYLEKMNSNIRLYNLSDFFSWGEPVQNIENLYRSHKALILASKVEGLPNVVCEALSCGTPCLVSNVLDHPKIISDNQSGFLFSIESPTSLVEAIEKLEMLSEKEYLNMSNSASKEALSLFDREQFTTQYITLIES